jgi:hypothetical protein
MDQLSSCYFCGGALDASLSEYPIIPKSLDPEAEKQGTVVLCSTCREKLATIVEPAVEAAKADARETVEPATDAGPAEPTGPSGGSETPTGNEGPVDSVIEPADDGSLLGDDGASAAKRSQADRQSGAGSTSGSDGTARDSAAPSDERTVEPSGGSDEGADGGDADAGENGDGSGPSLTKLEYNKVMRLLQNREMPVDRAEIREVAVNAYDIDGEQFDAIIDAAVDRDLIGQADGQLVESDG